MTQFRKKSKRPCFRIQLNIQDNISEFILILIFLFPEMHPNSKRSETAPRLNFTLSMSSIIINHKKFPRPRPIQLKSLFTKFSENLQSYTALKCIGYSIVNHNQYIWIQIAKRLRMQKALGFSLKKCLLGNPFFWNPHAILPSLWVIKSFYSIPCTHLFYPAYELEKLI